MATASMEDLHQTCTYFGNRAFGVQGTERIEWLTLLAESCHQALRRAEPTSTSLSADMLYLERLSELRTTIIDMNVDRFRDRRAPGALRTRRTVTASGEYLIAQRIGVMAAYNSWVEAHGIDTAVALP